MIVMADICLELLLIILVTLSAAADALSDRIPNGIVLPIAFSGLFLRIVWNGPEKIADNTGILIPVVLVFAGLFPIWFITHGKGIGAGDIKLLMAVAVLAPVWSILPICLVSFLTAGIYGMIRGLWAQACSKRVPGVHMAVFIAAAAGLHVIGMY